MICNRALIPLTHLENDYYLLPVLRTIEFSIYIKLSKIKHEGEILLSEYITNFSEYDKANFNGVYFKPHEFFMTTEEVFEEEYQKQDNYFKWDLNNEENNYYASQVYLTLLKNLYNFLAGNNDENSLILFVKENHFFRPFYVYCDPKLAKQDYFDMQKDQYYLDRDMHLVAAAQNLNIELKKAYELYNDEKKDSWYHRYLKIALLFPTEKAIEIVKNKMAV
ncbi:hypothetical protein FJO69_02110 [[Mycoplasma] falconis]|uniref:Uncharacterized protein n=1 Tax=[Mycoplasma] falconis TaxID=92403 RepID=A0A501X9T2_9BACT|nr:hypothetical protein [[Mycoplasma] falconis]TPE57280.1 hypothetical protein FJO69_02110 [[Mycoplasma] falconis]